MTERLYDSDSYLSEFECKITDIKSDADYFYIEADRTAFVPEGGGQTSDKGYLNDAYVENVQIFIFNFCFSVSQCSPLLKFFTFPLRSMQDKYSRKNDQKNYIFHI